MDAHALFGPISQLGYVTRDIEATAKAWTETIGIGPWTRMPNVTMPATMDGKEVEINIDVALCYHGDMQIELIKPLCNTPSPYSEFMQAGIEALHHVQFMTTDMNAAIEKAKAAGLEPACLINGVGGGSYTYLRGPGVWFEVMEASDGLLGLFDFIKSKSHTWDGKTLIEDLAL